MTNEIDDIGLKLCAYQAQLFEESIEVFGCSSIFFIKNFMHSNLAIRLDNKNFILEARDIKDSLNELNISKVNLSNQQYPTYILSWIGYLYRYACYKYHLSSKRIYKIIKPKELYALYDAYHALDVNEAITRILEAKNIDINNLNYSLSLAKKIYEL